MEDYDLVVLGWGGAAFSAAIRTSEITSGQAKIAMIGYGPIGGTCVNFGCVPSKFLIGYASDAWRASHLRTGLRGSVEVDFASVIDLLRRGVKEERRSKYEEVIATYDNVDLIEGKASFTSPSEVSVAPRGIKVRGYNFLVATGSRPKVPEVPGLKEAGCLTSDTLWNLSELPGRLAVLGGGPVGVELGQAFHRLGSEVTILQRRSHLVPRADPDLSSILKRSLESEGIRVETEALLVRVETRGKTKIVAFQERGERKEVEVDEILVAVGRRPNVEGLEASGIALSEKGIRVEPTMVTTNPRVYAAGDVVDQRMMLETLAAKEGALAAENMYEHAEREINVWNIPWAVFAEPQLASVGHTEVDYPGRAESRLLPLSLVSKARISGDENGVFKIVIDAETRRVVGVHVLAPQAAEFISQGALAVERGLTIDELVEGPHVFPTFSEGIKYAAQSFRRDISRMSCCVERIRTQ